MKLFTTVFALTLPLVCTSFELLSLGLGNREAIAQSIDQISKIKQAESTHTRLMKATRAKYVAGDLDGAFTLYEEMLQLARQKGNILEEVEALDLGSRLNNAKGEYSQAETTYRGSLLLLERNASKFITSEEIQKRNLLTTSLLTGLGIVYKNIGEYSQATEQLKLAVTQTQKFTVPKEFEYLLFQPRFELAFIYAKQQKYSESIALYTEGIEISKRVRDRGWESTFLVGLGSAYVQAGNLKVGMQFINQARSMDVFGDDPEAREQTNRSFESLDVEVNRVSGLASFLDGSINLLKRSTRELRQAYQIVSNDSRFSVISEFADSIEDVTVQFSNLSGFLKDGDLASVVRVSGLLANVLTKFASYSTRLELLMGQIESQPTAFRRLMNSQVLPSIRDVVDNLDELVEKFGGSKSNGKSWNKLKKN